MTVKNDSLTEAILETAEDMRRSGIMDEAAYKKITIRHLGKSTPMASKPVSGEEIRSMRESANLSQAVFARCLNLTPGYLSQLERGVREPKGPALALLNILKRTGMDAVL
jgi:putative transcriptional regulator